MKMLSKKLVCIMLAALMVIGIMPVTASAALNLEISAPGNWEWIRKSKPPTLEWNKVTGAAGYTVTVKNDETGEYYTQNEWTTKTSYDLLSLFDNTMSDSEYPRLEIWVGAMKSKDLSKGLIDKEAQDSIIAVVSDKPVVSMKSCHSITSTSVTLEMKISKDCGAEITDCGFVVILGTEGKEYSFHDYGSESATTKGTKTMTITGLKPGTRYDIRAYAENKMGKTISSKKSFTTEEKTGFEVSKSYISWGYGAGNEENITVTCPGEFTVGETLYWFTDNDLNEFHVYDWLDVTPSGKTINIRPKRANYYKNAREAEFEVIYGSEKRVITVVQAACGEDKPTISIKYNGTVLEDGMNLGEIVHDNRMFTAEITSENVRKVTANLYSVPDGKFINDCKSTERIMFDTSTLSEGDYKIAVYASNSDTSNDYWSQSPFKDGSMEIYFSLVKPDTGGGEEDDGSDLDNDGIVTFEQAKSKVLYSNNNSRVSVQRGYIRHMPQITNYTNFCDEYWKNSAYDLTEKISSTGKPYCHSLCSRAVYSMALSYIGVDLTPVDMSSFVNKKSIAGEYGTENPYGEVTKKIPNVTHITGTVDELYANYVKNDCYSPVYFHFSKPHCVLIIGKKSENVYYVVDPSVRTVTGVMSNQHVYEMTLDKDAKKVVKFTYKGEEIFTSWSEYKYSYIHQWYLNETSAPNTIIYDYNYNGGSVEIDMKKHGEAYTVSKSIIPTRPEEKKNNSIVEYEFGGWATTDGGDVIYQPGDVYKENKNLTLYATWKEHIKNNNLSPIYKVCVTYDANGGTGEPEASSAVSAGTTITLSTEKPTRPGYTFKGWATSASASEPEYQPGDSYTVNENVTLYAVWKKKTETYTVKYDANGGSGAPSAQTKTEGKALTLSSTKPIWSGYTFKGWATSASASDAEYQPGDSYTRDASVTLYAVWKKQSGTAVLGDVDGNGKINVIDANLIRRYSAKLIGFDESEFAAADVDGNGKVNVVDANLIRRYAAKLIEKFPAEE